MKLSEIYWATKGNALGGKMRKRKDLGEFVKGQIVMA